MQKSILFAAIAIIASELFAQQPAAAPTEKAPAEASRGAVIGAVMKPVKREIAPPPKPVFDVRSYGAKGDGVADDTEAVRKAIAACANSGGSVLLEEGKFVCGPLELKGGMTFYIAKDATLLAIVKPAAYPEIVPPNNVGTAAWGCCRRSLLYAYKAHKLRIDGGGTIDGQGVQLWHAGMRGVENARAMLLRVFQSNDVVVRNIRLLNSNMWTQVYDHCQGLVIENERVFSSNVRNSDGINVCNCRDVVIRNNEIDSKDDSICLKSQGPTGIANVLIENNTIWNRGANGIKFGTSTVGDITNVRIINNTISHAKLGGLCIESVDGSNVSNIRVSGLTMERVGQPFFVRLSLRGAYPLEIDPAIYPKKIGSISDVVIENVRVSATHSAENASCTLTGVRQKNLGQITLRNVYIEMPGGVNRPIDDPAENDSAYPQSCMFKAIPAYAFFVRHADNLRLENVCVRRLQPDARPWLVSRDAKVETIDCREVESK